MSEVPRRSLKHYIYKSWVFPGLFALITVVITFLLFAWQSYYSSTQRIHNDLVEKSKIVARRLAAEVLLGKNGAIEPVSTSLQQELSLSKISITQHPSQCRSNDGQSCIIQKDGFVQYYRKIPHVKKDYFVLISRRSPNLFLSVDYNPLIWSIIPIILVLALGIFLQRYYLKKYVLQPIEGLVVAAMKSNEPNKDWPKEISDIANQLYESFRQRDQAVIGKLTSGIIHDIKTPLQSIVAAIYLLDTKGRANSNRRKEFLENLADRCKDNIPIIGEIIETTLDMNREIHISRQTQDLIGTIESAVKINQERCSHRDGEIKIAYNGSVVVAHDSVQLARVFDNLIKNGIESVDGYNKSPRIKITVVEKTDELISIKFEDNGPGIPRAPEEMFQVFQSSKTHGTGLGLHNSKKIVEAHKGKLTAASDSTLGGAKFEIHLPVKLGELHMLGEQLETKA